MTALGTGTSSAEIASTATRPPSSLPLITVAEDALDPDDSRPRSVSTATKTALGVREVPQTIDTLEVSKFKVYGINDLSVMLDGTPGVDTSYDMRGDGITIRGFEASSGDIYRDGIRASGQIRRSTANVERIEILKGPASALYGRGAGGGIVNMISRRASFDAVSSIGVRAGSWGNAGSTVDINRVVSPNVALRITADHEEADSFRHGIGNRNSMLSPSIAVDTRQGLRWLAQYTSDRVRRRPDRAPSYDSLPANVSFRTAYAHPDDYVEDRMKMWRSVLDYDISPGWTLSWTNARHEADQNFDHLYAGSYCQPNGRQQADGRPCANRGMVNFKRAWQQTANSTDTNMFDLKGKLRTGAFTHDLLAGLEYSTEKRNPSLITEPAIGYRSGVNPYAPVWVLPKAPPGAPNTVNRHRSRTQAFYLQDMIGLTPEWRVLVGARHERYDFASHNALTNQQRSYNGSTLSPRAGVIWQAHPQHSLYASYSKDFSPYGGRGLLGVAVAESAVFDAEPQYARQFEVGAKSDWLDKRLSSQIALYDLRLFNIRYRPDPTNDPFHWAVRGQERSRGIETSVSGRIAADWYLRSGLGLQQAQVTEDVSAPARVGKYKSEIARKTGNLFLRYVANSHWYAELGVTYRGPIFNSIENLSKRSGYTRWDASVGWRALPWSVTLAVSNLTDKRYWRSSSMPGAPRSFLLSGNYVF